MESKPESLPTPELPKEEGKGEAKAEVKVSSLFNVEDLKVVDEKPKEESKTAQIEKKDEKLITEKIDVNIEKKPETSEAKPNLPTVSPQPESTPVVKHEPKVEAPKENKIEPKLEAQPADKINLSNETPDKSLKSVETPIIKPLPPKVRFNEDA